MRAECFALPTRLCSSAATASAKDWLSVTKIAAAITSCSAWLIKSAATSAGIALLSANIAISVGPASESIPTVPRSARLAAAT
ncbi:unannotated protein [freshwater metagenome]|uniref:Unannotated protein n=1 Tax=freshwater metagenome TaxID=449393 RepID=A0A6J6TUC6_9ZZZZ